MHTSFVLLLRPVEELDLEQIYPILGILNKQIMDKRNELQIICLTFNTKFIFDTVFIRFFFFLLIFL